MILDTVKAKVKGIEVDFQIHDTIVKSIKANRSSYLTTIAILSRNGYESRQFGQYPKVVKVR